MSESYQLNPQDEDEKGKSTFEFGESSQSGFLDNLDNSLQGLDIEVQDLKLEEDETIGDDDKNSDEEDNEISDEDKPESIKTIYLSDDEDQVLSSESDTDQLVYDWDKHIPIQFGDIHFTESEKCACKTAPNLVAHLSLMNDMILSVPSHENHNCLIDNIIRCYNFIFANTFASISPYRLAFADLFYRFRHELLFKCLCLSLNLPMQHSDISFEEFGLNSSRTPDLIIERENVIYIIEVTATSSIEKAAQSKGMEDMGFESKYQREIDEFNNKGIANSYLPMFFDMSEPKNLKSLEQFNSLAKVFNVNIPYKSLLFTMCQSLSGLTYNFKNNLTLPSALLFSNIINVEPNHKSLEFLYKKSKNVIPRNEYDEFTVSTQIYNKIHYDKHRFYWILDNSSFTDNQKLVFVVDSQNHRITSALNSNGKTLNELREILNSNDNIELMKCVKIKTGGLLLDSTSSETGVRFYEKVEKKGGNISNFEKLPLIASHNETPYMGHFCLKKYQDIMENYTSNNYHSLQFDPEYEDVIVNSIIDFDKNSDYCNNKSLPKNLLGSLRAVDIDILSVLDSIKIKYINDNIPNDDLPIRRLKMKSPFLLPLGDFNATSYCELNFKNSPFIEEFSRRISDENPYTKLILDSVMLSKYSMYSKANAPSKSYLDMESLRYSLSNKINLLQKEIYKTGTSDNVKQLSKTTDPLYRDKFLQCKKEFNNVNKELRMIREKEGLKQNISYIRLPTKNKGSDLRRFYDQEMSHFKDNKKQSVIEGVGIINNIESDYNEDSQIFVDICNLLIESRGPNPDMLLDENVYDDALLIKNLKEISIEKYSSLIKQVKDSTLGHACSFVSRFAHSLMFYSQLPFSSDYVRVDNLGYKNVLLIIKGGKKIFKSKSSKMFRLIYPISESVANWYIKGHKNKGSFRFTTINSILYLLTPWSMLHESILTDSISFYPRVTSFVFLNLNPAIDLKQQFLKVAINVLLSFHNRRKTEVILANLRYILLSTLGDFTGMTQILGEFFDFNYDRFQSFIRNSILLNYPDYFETLNKLKSVDIGNDNHGKLRKKEITAQDLSRCRLKNIFTGDVVNGTEDLALMIYSTFLMTKAPYQKLVERANNLKGILEINNYYNSTVGTDLNPEEQTEVLNINNKGDLACYARRLFDNDFNFDAKFCANVGCFIDQMYHNQNDNEDIETQWLRIMNKPWDEMATSTGLRGDYNKVEDFWGQKGYFVIYKELLKNTSFIGQINQILFSNISDDEKRKVLKSINEVYSDKIKVDREFLIFHAVDKVQWRGGREIYVMDVFTKTLQQPIEQFMAVLCKKLDNELISIPSDRRAQVIHHSIFEKDLPTKDTLVWYLTLDCSKWAPKSVFIKFVTTILNMRCIPNSFKTHFMNYIDKLYKKRVYFNKGEVEVLSKNPQYKELCDQNLVFDKQVDGYYLLMPYSWVMGIFNYTSSFLHAANQKYISYLLMKTSLISFGEETSLTMFAHSDDSGGRLSVSSMNMAQRALILYEIFLKSCNHILSRKKSVVSRIYFEILSVIYIFNKLLALLPKFLGGLRFLPTDKGPAQDMLQSYSKCIEVMVAGGDFCIAYIVLKVYSMMVWRFYYNRKPVKLDYERPVQYLGLPDSHPLFILLCGSDADIIRLIRNCVNLTDLMSFINTMVQTVETDGPIKPLKFEIKVKGIKRGFEDYMENFKEVLSTWSLGNVNYHNTGLNALSFLKRLSDSGFVGSLVNESTVRRISRGYFLRIGDSAMTTFGNIKLTKIMDSMILCQSYSQGQGAIKHLLEDILTDEDLKSINTAFEENKERTNRMLELVKRTMRSPLRIYKYMDMISMKDRKIEFRPKTLKPTLVQLVKSSQVFSTDFDPASLVSFIKEPNMRWALNNVRGLAISEIELRNFMDKMGYNINNVDPDILLRVCRTYGRENTKNIYLYSRVPGEIRQIKTYSAFLTFLSVNSFSNHEIQGLTIKLSEREVGREYMSPYLIEEVYTVNNVLSLISTLIDKSDLNFVTDMPLNPIDEISWGGGKVSEFLSTHFDYLYDTDVRYNIIRAQHHSLLMKISPIPRGAGFLNDCAFYTFLKSQKVRSGWYGKGEVYIHIDRSFYSFVLINNDIDQVYTNRSGKLPLHHSEFIQDVIRDIGMNLNTMKKPKISNYNKQHFGIDNTGDFSIYKGRDLGKGILATVIERRNDFVDNLESFQVQVHGVDTLIINRGFEGYNISRKINLLPVRKVELVPLIKQMLVPEYFKERLELTGLNNFEDFVLTEVLTEYGKDIVIDFNSFVDNYQSSRLYNIFKETHDKGYSKINKSPIYSPLPAFEGSLVRILIDYTACTNDRIINTPTNIDSKIMQMRVEYSDFMTTLLGDKLSEYHKSIYTSSEIKEISDHYNNLFQSNDVNKVRMSLIKLMTYWGYGSLVNSLQEFTLTRSNKNYKFFNSFNLNKITSKAYADMYPYLIKELNKLMYKWQPLILSLETPINLLLKNTNVPKFIDYYCMEACMGTYNMVTTNVKNSLYNLQYINVLLGLMMEEEFIGELQLSLSKHYILSSIPITWQLRNEFIATINVLKSIWQGWRSQEFNLDFITKVQRYPDNIVHFKSMLKDFDITTNPAEVHYNGFLNNSLISLIMSKGEIVTDMKYRISSKIIPISTIEVEMGESLKHPTCLTADAVCSDALQDINYEFTMDPIDYITIDELKEEIPKPIYETIKTKKLKVKSGGMTIIQGVVKWVVCPYVSNTWSRSKYFRQTGENFVVITDTYLSEFRNIFPNSGIRIVNYTKVLKSDCKPVFLHYSFQKVLYNNEFISKYLGGQEFYYRDSDESLLKANITRNIDGTLTTPGSLGLNAGAREMADDTILVERDGYLEYVDIETFKKEETASDENKKIMTTLELNLDRMKEYGTDDEIEKMYRLQQVNKQLDDIESEGLIDTNSIKSMRDKYSKSALQERIPLSLLLLSNIQESEMIKINLEILNNSSGVSASDQKKMFLAPENFGLGKVISKSDSNPIRDKKARAEINSLHPDLALQIGANTLNISFKLKKVVDANFRMWVRLNKTTKTKLENKNFLLTLIASLCANTFASNDESDDGLWQEIINKTTVYLSEEDSSDSEEDEISLLFNTIPASRLVYRPAGT